LPRMCARDSEDQELERRNTDESQVTIQSTIHSADVSSLKGEEHTMERTSFDSAVFRAEINARELTA
jgi:hypothetical protein